MRIGILTFHRPINYGAFLQAFSLSDNIKNSFPTAEVEIVDYIAPKEQKKIVINILWEFKHYGITNGIKHLQKIAAFNNSYIQMPLSPKVKTNELNSLYGYIDERYDLLIIGSDAIFNWNQNGYPTAFIPQYTFNKCKIVTYAGSVHGLKYKVESKKINECGDSFRKMALVGTRDFCTEQFVQYCAPEINPIHCCDPTVVINKEKILLLAEGYIEKVNRKYKCDLNKKYIVLMLPDSTLTHRIHDFYSSDYQIITLFKPSRDADFYLGSLNPFEWCAVLSEASAVITSYFHGTLLSLVYGSPVIAIDYSDYNSDGYEGKLKDLLYTRLNLPELYYDSHYIEDLPTQDSIINQINETLKGDYFERIEKSVIIESKAYNSYIEKLKSLVSVE